MMQKRRKKMECSADKIFFLKREETERWMEAL